jgi:hypothetical protein
MNENGKIEREELSFLYKLILEGRSDSDILNEYAYLNDVGQLKFPLRTDDNLIKDRRMEMEIVVEVLKNSIKQAVKPLISRQREEHFAQVAEISGALLENNLMKVRPDTLDGARYIIYNGNNVPKNLNKWQLLDLLRKNIDNVYRRYTIDVFDNYYLPHLKALMPEMEAQGFWPQVETDPYQVITKIRELTERENLKGVCPLCNGLEDQLPPLLRPDYSYVA